MSPPHFSQHFPFLQACSEVQHVLPHLAVFGGHAGRQRFR